MCSQDAINLSCLPVTPSAALHSSVRDTPRLGDPDTGPASRLVVTDTAFAGPLPVRRWPARSMAHTANNVRAGDRRAAATVAGCLIAPAVSDGPPLGSTMRGHAMLGYGPAGRHAWSRHALLGA